MGKRTNCIFLDYEEESFIIPNDLEVVDEIFNNCDDITEDLVFENDSSVHTINQGAFRWFVNLKTLFIPKSVETINMPIFGETGVEEIIVEEGNKDFISVDGVLYSADMKKLICYPSNRKEVAFIIPSSVEEIGEYAFSYCPYIKVISFTTKSKCKIINDYSFFNLGELSILFLTSNVEKLSPKFLLSCENVDRIELNPESSTSRYEVKRSLLIDKIEKKIVRIACSATKNVCPFLFLPSKETYNIMGEYAFSGCSIHSIDIQEYAELQFEKIMPKAFSRSQLTEVLMHDSTAEKRRYIFDNNSVYCIENRMLLFSCCETDEFMIRKGTRIIGEEALSNLKCETIIIPKSVTKICNNAFNSNDEYKYRYLGNLQDWLSIDFEEEAELYFDFDGLEINDPKHVLDDTIFVPEIEEIKTRGLCCFQDKDIWIPKSVKRINSIQFYESDYGNIISSIFYEGSIDEWAQIDFQGRNPNPIANNKTIYFNKNENLELIHHINSEVINENAFARMPNLRKLYLGNVHLFKHDCFLNSNNLGMVHYNGTIKDWLALEFENDQANPLGCGAYLSLNNEVIHDLDLRGISRIQDYAFSGCDSINRVYLDSHMQEIGFDAFLNCDRLEAVYFYGNLEDWLKINFKNEYSNPLANHADFYLNDVLFTDIIINQDISNYAFYGCLSLRKAVIRKAVSFGDRAFKDCFRLINVENETNENYYIRKEFGYVTAYYQEKIFQKNDFYYYEKDKERHLVAYDGNAEKVDLNCFGDNMDTYIENYAFSNVKTVQFLTLAPNVVKVKKKAFRKCFNLFLVNDGSADPYFDGEGWIDDCVFHNHNDDSDYEKHIENGFIAFKRYDVITYSKWLKNEKELTILADEHGINVGLFSLRDSDKLEVLTIGPGVNIHRETLLYHPSLKKVIYLGSRDEFFGLVCEFDDYVVDLEFKE